MNESAEVAAYSSAFEFYAAERRNSVASAHPIALGATVFVTRQAAGDWSDKPIDDLGLAFTLKGAGAWTADLGAGRFHASLRPNERLLRAPGAGSSIQVEADHTVLHVGIPYQRLCDTVGDDVSLPRDGDFGRLHARPLADRVLSDLTRALYSAAQTDADASSGLLGETLLVAMGVRLAQLKRQGDAPARDLTPPRGLAPWQIKRVEDYIEAHLSETLSLTELASLVGLSAYHFCRAFKQSTGLPPFAWQIARRMRRAQELMRAAPSSSLFDVALAVGYESQSAFSAAFKRVVGETPRQWRRSHIA